MFIDGEEHPIDYKFEASKGRHFVLLRTNKKVTELPKDLFMDLTDLIEVSIPACIKSIPENFLDCPDLQIIRFNSKKAPKLTYWGASPFRCFADDTRSAGVNTANKQYIAPVGGEGYDSSHYNGLLLATGYKLGVATDDL